MQRWGQHRISCSKRGESRTRRLLMDKSSCSRTSCTTTVPGTTVPMASSLLLLGEFTCLPLGCCPSPVVQCSLRLTSTET
ncbi:hypothetical protein DPMN_181962 [Dreissena polymorpha]|uniref:Uncharacterized protein n=1 Tax=Dreissena polymorpha TaxID=45954 RepID=A0A9D4I464_DREPO|nr:hypothetical protein DPMN_181962 [Dreissena polymorpha]